MADRRILVVIVAVTIATVALLSSGSGPETSPAATTRSDRGAVTVVGSSTVAAPIASTSSTRSATPREPDVPAIGSSESPTVGDATESVSITGLLADARPTIPAEPVVDDGHQHEREAAQPDEVIAASLIVAAWSWRFDDRANHAHVELRPLADPELIEQITPTSIEIARRIEHGEVAWVIVRSTETAGSTVTVQFDHHVITSTRAETITTRRATVTVEVGIAVAVQVD